MEIELDESVDFFDLKNELVSLFKIKPSIATWELSNTELKFHNDILKEEFEFHEYEDGTPSEVMELLNRHKKVSEQCKRKKEALKRQVRIRTRKIISKKYMVRDEFMILAVGIKDPENEEFLKYHERVMTSLHLREEWFDKIDKLKTRSKKDLEKLKDFVVNINPDDY